MDNPEASPHIVTMDSEILIVGGGLNGTALALALAESGVTSTVIDSMSSDQRGAADFDGRSYALALASTRMLGAIGLWGRLADQAQPIQEIKVSDGRAGEGPSPFFLHFDQAEMEDGPMGYMVEDRFLRPALLDTVMAHPLIRHIAPETVIAQEVSAQGAAVTLRGGQRLRGQLLVGADGRQSGTAARAGIKRTGWSYDQTALVCAIEHDQPHHGIAHQFFMPSGPLAILPLAGNRSSIVWTETNARAGKIQSASDADYLKILRPRFGNFLGDIALAGARFTYPLALSLAQSFVTDRLALIGDAAHGMHPIAGQGLNAGFRDMAALAEVLICAKRRGEDIANPITLAEYQRWRRFDTTTLAVATDGFNRLFSNDNGSLRLIRDLGMAAVNAVPGLRRNFMREAAGLTGDLPKLMQGRAL